MQLLYMFIVVHRQFSIQIRERTKDGVAWLFPGGVNLPATRQRPAFRFPVLISLLPLLDFPNVIRVSRFIREREFVCAFSAAGKFPHGSRSPLALALAPSSSEESDEDITIDVENQLLMSHGENEVHEAVEMQPLSARRSSVTVPRLHLSQVLERPSFFARAQRFVRNNVHFYLLSSAPLKSGSVISSTPAFSYNVLS